MPFQPAITLTKKPMSRREKKILSVWHPKQIEYFRKYHRLANVELKMLEKSHKIFQFFDLVDIFDDMNEKDEIFLDSCHFGDKGYDIISKKIYSLILPEISKGKINN